MRHRENDSPSCNESPTRRKIKIIFGVTTREFQPLQKILLQDFQLDWHIQIIGTAVLIQ